MQTIWHNGSRTDPRIMKFTASNDRHLDLRLARADIAGSLAHVKMLAATGIIGQAESDKLQQELRRLYQMAEQGVLELPQDAEDIHSFIEYELTKALGNAGKKIHTARSRNDQVLLDIRLYVREEIRELSCMMGSLFDILIHRARQNSGVMMPGYTHMQVAMPSSFGLWFSAFAESLADDLLLMQAAWKLANQNPLGSGAGYGTGFPINREMTTSLLGFDGMNINSVYAQMTRGKVERTMAVAMASVASTLSRMTGDVCLYLGQNYGFFSLPGNLSTGSSIMPHKKNPDALELVRARCNRLQALPNEMAIILTNLPTGYHRDLQLLKESFFPAIDILKECLEMACIVMKSLVINADVTHDPLYDEMYSVELVQKKVQEGIPFREAYQEVARSLYLGKNCRPNSINHTHTGSIGNLCLEQIQEKFKSQLQVFDFQKTQQAVDRLIDEKPVVNHFILQQ